MKLRIKENSLRIRLTRSEVARLASEGSVESATEFGPASRLFCRVEASGSAFEIQFSGDAIRLAIPAVQIREWAASEELSLPFRHAWATGALDILVEKDLVCAKPRPGDDQSDNYTLSGALSHCS